jgi:hypothetical protein
VGVEVGNVGNPWQFPVLPLEMIWIVEAVTAEFAAIPSRAPLTSIRSPS